MKKSTHFVPFPESGFIERHRKHPNNFPGVFSLKKGLFQLKYTKAVRKMTASKYHGFNHRKQ